MFCERCGTYNTDDAKFCLKCGAPLEEKAADEAYTVAANEDDDSVRFEAGRVHYGEGFNKEYNPDDNSSYGADNNNNYDANNNSNYGAYNNSNYGVDNNGNYGNNYGGSYGTFYDNGAPKLLTTGRVLGLMCINLIPIVGPLVHFILLIVFACMGKQDQNRAAMCRGMLFYDLICLALGILVLIIFGATLGAALNSSMSYGYY